VDPRLFQRDVRPRAAGRTLRGRFHPVELVRKRTAPASCSSACTEGRRPGIVRSDSALRRLRMPGCC
jgi:hypothetical protein